MTIELKNTVLKGIGLSEELPEQKIKSKTLFAIAFRNIYREKVDSLFERKNTIKETLSTNKLSTTQKEVLEEKVATLDFEARQRWRDIIRTSNSM